MKPFASRPNDESTSGHTLAIHVASPRRYCASLDVDIVTETSRGCCSASRSNQRRAQPRDTTLQENTSDNRQTTYSSANLFHPRPHTQLAWRSTLHKKKYRLQTAVFAFEDTALICTSISNSFVAARLHRQCLDLSHSSTSSKLRCHRVTK